MARQATQAEIETVRTLKREGFSNYAIAKKTGWSAASVVRWTQNMPAATVTGNGTTGNGTNVGTGTSADKHAIIADVISSNLNTRTKISILTQYL